MKTNWLKITAAVVALGFATSAYAVPTLYISTTGLAGSYVAVGSSASGVVTYAGANGAWSLVVSTGLTAPALGSTALPIMDLNVQASTTTGGSLWVAFAANGYTGLGSLAASLTGHVVSGAPETLSFVTFGDASNAQPTSTLPTGSNITSLSGPLGSPLNGSGALPGSTPYTLGIVVGFTSAGASANSIDASFVSAPDGGVTAMLLGAGLTGLFMLRKKIVA